MPEITKRRQIANYLKVENSYKLLGVGFTELDESPSAQTTSKRYVNDASATQSVTGYEATWGFTSDLIKSEEAIELIYKIGAERRTGADAESTMLIVDLDETESEGVFYAREQKVAISVDDFADEDGEMTVSGDFLGVGDPVVGKATITGDSVSFTSDKG